MRRSDRDGVLPARRRRRRCRWEAAKALDFPPLYCCSASHTQSHPVTPSHTQSSLGPGRRFDVCTAPARRARSFPTDLCGIGKVSLCNETRGHSGSGRSAVTAVTAVAQCYIVRSRVSVSVPPPAARGSPIMLDAPGSRILPTSMAGETEDTMSLVDRRSRSISSHMGKG